MFCNVADIVDALDIGIVICVDGFAVAFGNFVENRKNIVPEFPCGGIFSAADENNVFVRNKIIFAVFFENLFLSADKNIIVFLGYKTAWKGKHSAVPTVGKSINNAADRVCIRNINEKGIAVYGNADIEVLISDKVRGWHCVLRKFLFRHIRGEVKVMSAYFDVIINKGTKLFFGHLLKRNNSSVRMLLIRKKECGAFTEVAVAVPGKKPVGGFLIIPCICAVVHIFAPGFAAENFKALFKSILFCKFGKFVKGVLFFNNLAAAERDSDLGNNCKAVAKLEIKGRKPCIFKNDIVFAFGPFSFLKNKLTERNKFIGISGDIIFIVAGKIINALDVHHRENCGIFRKRRNFFRIFGRKSADHVLPASVSCYSLGAVRFLK